MIYQESNVLHKKYKETSSKITNAMRDYAIQFLPIAGLARPGKSWWGTLCLGVDIKVGCGVECVFFIHNQERQQVMLEVWHYFSIVGENF